MNRAGRGKPFIRCDLQSCKVSHMHWLFWVALRPALRMLITTLRHIISSMFTHGQACLHINTYFRMCFIKDCYSVVPWNWKLDSSHVLVPVTLPLAKQKKTACSLITALILRQKLCDCYANLQGKNAKHQCPQLWLEVLLKQKHFCLVSLPLVVSFVISWGPNAYDIVQLTP